MNDSGRVEGMETLASMLEYQHIRAVFDAGDFIAKAAIVWSEAAITSTESAVDIHIRGFISFVTHRSTLQMFAHRLGGSR